MSLASRASLCRVRVIAASLNQGEGVGPTKCMRATAGPGVVGLLGEGDDCGALKGGEQGCVTEGEAHERELDVPRHESIEAVLVEGLPASVPARAAHAGPLADSEIGAEHRRGLPFLARCHIT